MNIMIKKVIIIPVVLACFVMTVGSLDNVVDKNNKSEIVTSVNQKESAAVWKEVPIEEGKYVAQASLNSYDLKETISEADYVFSGTITNRKEFEVQWTDENGEIMGPYLKSVVEVKINKEYYGESPVSGDSIRVYYPYSLSTDFEGSFSLEEQQEYIFVTENFDEEFIERRKMETPESKYEHEKYADVYISSACYDLLPVDNGEVCMYHDYFYWDDNVMKKTISGEAIRKEDIVDSELIDSGWFIVLEEQEFNREFDKLFKNSNELPNAEELEKIHKNKKSHNQNKNQKDKIIQPEEKSNNKRGND